MARYMITDDAFRGVVVVKVLKRDEYGNLVETTGRDLIGPYDKASVAKAQVTTARRERGKGFVDGWVERAVAWERID